MTTEDSAEKVHYICQTYVAKPIKGSDQVSLQIGKQFQYTTAAQAQERAEREARSEDCAGADAYYVVEDAGSGEVSEPTFLVRVGDVPDMDAL
ncbi:hypothetical protein [Litoreibacter albidus]|uniref:Uncharacterized protein n=1 Tax=Litoreibacter albidus TaxID=670155 RepID=A0A1H2Y5I1_9RHOB|nr:hypothetical protein [Litoreibacter albidus]SDX00301.1 hypothetical protein SAMN04488001_2221 [Litoreibacter albidus]